MPSGLAESARRALKEADKSGLVLQRSAGSKTGFTNVIPVNDKFQARLQVAGDGRGGSRKRKQHSLPGLFSTALEAAQFLALFKKEYEERGLSGSDAPPSRTSRTSRAQSSRSRSLQSCLQLSACPCACQ